MTKRTFKFTLFVIIGIVALYVMKVPLVVTYVDHGIVVWNWSVDRVLNFRTYHPLLYAFLPILFIIILAHNKHNAEL